MLFVHGIGQQTQSSCLREFSEPMVSWLKDWHAANAPGRPVLLRDSVLSYGESPLATPAHFVISVPGAAVSRSARAADGVDWVFTEAWWAARLDPPNFVAMLGWVLKIGWRIALQLALGTAGHMPDVWRHVAEGGARPNSLGQRLRAASGILIELVSLGFLMIGYVVSALLGYLLLWPLFLIAHVPLPAVQQFVLLRLLRPLLVDYVGDFRVYTGDAVQGLHIRHGVERSLAWLAAQTDDIIVIAHSQGAVVAYDTLAAATAGVEKVRTLVTMGGALNKAWQLDSPPAGLLAPLPASVSWLDIWSGYDPVAGGAAIRGHAANHEVTNGMNVITDHGGYFGNREEVIARLVQQADAGPNGYEHSQFWLKDYPARVQRRWERVVTLVAWRLWAMILVLGVMFARYSRIESDGERIWAGLGRIPGVSGVGELLGGGARLVSDLADAISTFSEPTPAISVVFKVVREVTAPHTWAPIATALIAVAGYGAAIALAYWILTMALYAPWQRRDAALATDRDFAAAHQPPRLFRWSRAVAVPLWLTLAAALFRV